MLLMSNKRGNRQVSKKNLLLLDKYVKKEETKNKDKSGGDDNVSSKTESKT